MCNLCYMSAMAFIKKKPKKQTHTQKKNKTIKNKLKNKTKQKNVTLTFVEEGKKGVL